MTTSSTLLRHSRCAARLSQRENAKAARVPQPSIARVESGRRDVNVETLDIFLRPTGNRLIAVPTTGSPAAEAAIAIADYLSAADERGAFRQFIQLHDDLNRAAFHELVVLTFAPAPSTGDLRFDALLAGLVEHHFGNAPLDAPLWTAEVPGLNEPWHVDPYTARQPSVPDALAAFLGRNIVLRSSELDSR